MDNENILGTNIYDRLIEQKLTELQMQKDKEWDEYQQKLDELQKEYNDKIDELEESEMQIGMFRNLDSDNLTIEKIEDLLNNLDSMNFSEEDLVVIMSHLADLSTHDLIYENGLESNDIVEEKPEETNQEEPQKSDKEIAKEIVDNYESISTEAANVMKEKTSIDFETNYNRAIGISADSNLEKTPEQRLRLEDYIVQAGKLKKKFDAIEDDLYYLKTAIEGIHYKSIANNKDEIYIRINRLKETIEEIQESFPLYQYAYTRFDRVFENQILSKKEVVEDLSKLEKIEPSINDDISEDITQDKAEGNEEAESLQETASQETEFKDEETDNIYTKIDPIIEEEYEQTYGEALKLMKNYKKAIELKLIDDSSYLHSYFDALNIMIETGFRVKEKEEEIKEITENLKITNEAIEGAVNGELKHVLFPEPDIQHMNIGDKNIIIFLDDNGSYLIEEDLNSMVSGDRMKATDELKKSIETKYTVRSWNNDLRLNSDNLKGSKVKVGSKIYEARNCKCGTGSTRISVWPVSLNPSIKERIKKEYKLDDNFENVLLVCGIALNHRINEHLKGQINSNSKRITEIDEMFSNPSTDFKDIEELIESSSKVCGKVFESEAGQRV